MTTTENAETKRNILYITKKELERVREGEIPKMMMIYVVGEGGRRYLEVLFESSDFRNIIIVNFKNRDLRMRLLFLPSQNENETLGSQ